MPFPGVAVRRVLNHSAVEARCPEDGMIEAIRRREGSYVAAVQWHPEFHPPGHQTLFDDSALLQDFLAAARAAASR